MAPNYEKFSTEGNWDSPKRLAAKIQTDLPDGGKMLDLGVGTGWLEDALALSEDWQITGVDISSKMLEKVSQRHPGVKLKQGLIQDFKALIGDNKYDLIVSTGALEFVPGLEAVIKDISASLNPNGIIAFTYEAKEPGQANWRDYSTTTSTQTGTMRVYRRSKEDVDKAIADANLEVTSHELYGGYERDNKPVPYGLVVARKLSGNG